MFEAGLLRDKKLENMYGNSDHSFLSVFFCTEIYNKREDPSYVSKYQEWIDVLPENTDDFPVNYTDEQKALLEGTDMTKIIQDKDILLVNDYKYICEKVPEMKKFDFKDYKFWVDLWQSRAFTFTTNGVKSSAIVPFADMLNTEIIPNCSYKYDEESQQFIYYAFRDISFGEQFTTMYIDNIPNHNNKRFLE